MMVNVAQVFVLIFGILVGVLAAWGIFAPKALMRFVQGVMERDSGIYAAVVPRLILGAALIFAAAESRFPTAFQVIGGVAILAAIGLAFMGRARLIKFVAYFDRFSPALIRVWLLLGVGFSGLLVYGVL